MMFEKEGSPTPPPPPPRPIKLLAPICYFCGQFHEKQDAHLYDYHQTVDKDLTCLICLQPLVSPVDTNCGHTFCRPCMIKQFRTNKSCPVDRYPLNERDLRSSNVILRKLLDKLLVVCPNTDYCEEVLPRCELDAHLQYRCKGAVIKCLREEQGCTFQGPRSALQSHLWECPFKDVTEGENSIGWVPVADGGITTLDIQRGCYDLGISIVGGIDTPLMCVLIQEVHPEGIAFKDGRLQAGDQLLEVNGIDLTNVTHLEARDALLQPYPICRMSVYREKSESQCLQEKEEMFKITLPKLSGKSLGIKLVNRKSCPGLFIFEVIPGSTAFIDGRLQKEDRILQINDVDMTYGSQEQALKMIQMAADKVQMRISRMTRAQTPDILRSSPSKESLLNFSVYSRESLFSYYPFMELPEKLVHITKEKDESLGVSVAGGVHNQKADTPIYISNIQPGGCLGRTRQVQKGDVLLSINGHSLLELTHPEAVRLIKKCAGEENVALKILEGNESPPNNLDHYQPSWKFWLQMPEQCHCIKTVHLERSVHGSLGFSIVGGCDSGLGLVPIFVKAVVPGTPAATDGKLRSGDMLLGVNGQGLEDVAHTDAVSLLKGAKGQKVTLRVVTWPGTYV